jgi:hypothetical protein
MNDIIALKTKNTNAGRAAILNASNNGLEGVITHVSFGDGNGVSYTPNGTEIALRNEVGRVAIGGGNRDAPDQVTIQGMLGDIGEHWIREIGFHLSDGTLLSVWSEQDDSGDDILLLYKKDGVPFIFAFTILLPDLPDNSVNVQVSGPTVNVVFDTEFALIIANQARITRQQWHQQEAFYAQHGHYPGGQS